MIDQALIRIAQIAQELEDHNDFYNAEILDNALSLINNNPSPDKILDTFTTQIMQEVAQRNGMNITELLSNRGQHLLAGAMSETLLDSSDFI